MKKIDRGVTLVCANTVLHSLCISFDEKCERAFFVNGVYFLSMGFRFLLVTPLIAIWLNKLFRVFLSLRKFLTFRNVVAEVTRCVFQTHAARPLQILPSGTSVTATEAVRYSKRIKLRDSSGPQALVEFLENC